MTAEIVAELDSGVVRAPTEEPRAGVFVKATLVAIVVLQVVWSSALVLVVASVIR
jgi:hypothetical protein